MLSRAKNSRKGGVASLPGSRDAVLGGDMHSNEHLLVQYATVVIATPMQGWLG